MAAYYGRPTVQPSSNFNSERAATKLRKAMKGIESSIFPPAGTDDRAIIDVLVGHSNSQRQEIKRKYKSLYGRDVVEDIQTELGGHFEDVCVALLTPQAEFLADCLNNAIKGLGTDENCIIEILCSHQSKEISEIKLCYKQKYNKELEEALHSDSRGEFRRLITSLLAGNREGAVQVDWDLAETEAQRLYDGGIGRLGTDEEIFTKILCGRSSSQIQATLRAYERIGGHSLTAAIEAEFSGDVRDTLLAIVQCIQNRTLYFARQLNKCVRGLGTDDQGLVRILVSRSEIDLEDVKLSYKSLYNKELADDVSEDTSGDYRKALLRIIQP